MYFSAGEAGLYVFDISDPENPVVIDSVDTPGCAQTCVLKDDYLYVSDWNALLIFQSSLISDVKEKEIFMPTEFKLEQNYPNPFNPLTEIKYTISKPSQVTLKVFNINGKEVTTLVDSRKQEGKHTVRWDASGFSSGLYLCKMTAGDYTQVKRMLYLK